MVNQQLLNPQSIVVIGGSNDLSKPGGKILHHILKSFKGKIYVTNPKTAHVQGIETFSAVEDLPDNIDLAVIAVAAKYCPCAVKTLALNKGTKAFIIISAGFSEESEQGALYEREIVEVINQVDGCLIGPNCIGMMNQNHHSVFTTPIPVFSNKGVDFISGSGATAVFIMEIGRPLGLRFNSVYSVGNSAQIGVEDVLEYLDLSYNPKTSSKIKLLYIESVNDGKKLLKHARSLINKGCKIAGIKAGFSEDGSRAASSHTGAMANSDMAVDALFKKAGIVRCYGRMELAVVGAIYMTKEFEGRNIAIITHAGGPAVMLTDTLSKAGFKVPKLDGEATEKLKEKLYDGSSVANPIDFLATGNAEQLAAIIDACENDFDQIDAIVVIFGSSGLFPVKEVYEVLHQKSLSCQKPIFAILPSIINVKDDIETFISKGHVNFPDEVIFGEALAKVYFSNDNNTEEIRDGSVVDLEDLIEKFEDGYLPPEKVSALISKVDIPFVAELVLRSTQELDMRINHVEFPVVLKVIGPVHKSDVGGVFLNVKDAEELYDKYDKLMQIEGAEGVLIQQMVSGIELFLGAKYDEGFGHTILCGLGGVFVEVLKDVSYSMAPVSKDEALNMIKSLKGIKILHGLRGQEGVNIDLFAEIIVQFSNLVYQHPEIKEIDLNPLMGNLKRIVAVDARIRIEKGE
ncbi:acetate--CoA ligase family protein [Plebeiibacterium sediminum]|uniref:Acetate--CoA ligase family protein n=1 Tax=Plebeiibacterium sediminum TaxID=2992112 RepID=A0AAE3M7S3_9BACT|nr:acetate--CoA ligase family protein [Plebeiobacterium sediminum]MCW3788663.1 acetate--CoA ligase family protein [Plebeiobacterium sediminum]